ncbi:MAG TPA: FtsH protease activity modulator HflK [Sediminispirochaeta sp.]|nr:FtsH protease activity modulator HflK [Sediminispirochaeta sp.]
MSEKDVTPFRLPFSFKPKYVVAVIVIIGIIAAVMSSFFIVDQTEQAVVLRFGKVDRMVGPGLQFKIPFGIEKNYNVPTRQIQKQEFGFRTQQSGVQSTYSSGDFPEESVMLTGDLNIADVEWIIQYRISDPTAWLFNVEFKEQTIRDISQSVINQLVGDRAILDVIGSERPTIEQRGQELMQARYDQYGLGITVTTVKLRNIVPPKGEVQDAFEDVNKAVQDMNRLINEGKEAYNQEIPKARGQAKQLVQEAQGYAAERVNNARGDVARFNSVYEEYVNSPEVTRTRLYIETIEDVFKEDKETDLIDRELENFLPLKNLQSQGGLEQ